jgi:hypothetical protein
MIIVMQLFTADITTYKKHVYNIEVWVIFNSKSRAYWKIRTALVFFLVVKETRYLQCIYPFY